MPMKVGGPVTVAGKVRCISLYFIFLMLLIKCLLILVSFENIEQLDEIAVL